MPGVRFGLGSVWVGTALIAVACGGGGGDAGPGAADGPPGPPGDGAIGDGTPADDGSVEPARDATIDGPSDATMAAVADGANEASMAAVDGNSEAGDGSSFDAPQPVSPFIAIDQFGYRTSAEKIAVIRNPQVGFDALSPFTPGATYAVVDAHSAAKLLEGAPVTWNGGATDPSSGDKAWWFDFSTVTTPGDYFVLDETRNVRSNVFHVSDDVYRSVLAQAIRMFYYQRDGIAKTATYAGAAYADDVEHPQNAQCAAYTGSGTTDGGPPKDLRGGWFDAGDQSKYTNFAASNVIELLRAYTENPSVFRDDYNIPESGNGVPDVLDEAKWGLDWLARMQNADGSVLTVVANAGGSPPSSDTAPCIFGPANTSATLTTAAAFAQASMVFGASSAVTSVYPGYAAALQTKALSAWNWASANPNLTFFNSPGLAGREQEVDNTGRLDKTLQAAAFLFELTGDHTYQTAFQQTYAKLAPAAPDPFDAEPSESLLEYTKTVGAADPNAQSILSMFKSNIETTVASQRNADPYLAYIQSPYPAGSNQGKTGQGNLFYDLVSFHVDPVVVPDGSADGAPDASSANQDAVRSAERYIHYLHGVNPLLLVYVSNMGDYGAESYVTRFFSEWFANGSRWDAVGVSTYGPPPGFLTWGPNPAYSWDGCCPLGCGGGAADADLYPQLNALCGPAPLSPPAGQPDQKSYKDFNTSWPLDSWQVSEPHDSNQTQYVRLLSKFTL